MKSVKHQRSGRERVVQRGFTLIELLVVVSIIALLISILLPSLGKAKEYANRAYCAANLHGISESLILYSEEFDTFPTTAPPVAAYTYAPLTGVPAVGTGNADTTLSLVSANEIGSPLACLWMLNLRNMAPPKVFLCKSDRLVITPAATVNPSGLYYENFQDKTQISYSITYPWVGSTTSTVWRGRDGSSGSPLMSDMAPLSDDSNKKTDAAIGETTTGFNTANHEGTGQNVSYADSHVDWCRTPYVGANNENIFTVRPTSGSPLGGGTPITAIGTIQGPIVGTDYPFDTVMVPARKTSDGTL
jgi:prepilin-type N-terminal cleavage/methylation domain-containing protein